jgi:hypothetical protein
VCRFLPVDIRNCTEKEHLLVIHQCILLICSFTISPEYDTVLTASGAIVHNIVVSTELFLKPFSGLIILLFLLHLP